MAIKVNGVSVRHNDTVYHHDDIIEKIDDSEANRLVDLGFAFFVEKNEVTSLQEENIPVVDEDDSAKLLDDSYSYEDLKTTAAEVGLKFKGNIKKKELIALIIEQDKVDEFFEDEDQNGNI